MKKRILSLLGIIALFLGVILVSCGNDDDNKNTTGVHKIVIEQSGNTDDFDLNIAFGAANTSGVAKLYNENGEYLGDSYLVNKVNNITNTLLGEKLRLNTTGATTQLAHILELELIRDLRGKFIMFLDFIGKDENVAG